MKTVPDSDPVSSCGSAPHLQRTVKYEPECGNSKQRCFQLTGPLSTKQVQNKKNKKKNPPEVQFAPTWSVVGVLVHPAKPGCGKTNTLFDQIIAVVSSLNFSKSVENRSRKVVSEKKTNG